MSGLESDGEVSGEESEDDEDPGPDREEGGGEAEADGAVGGVQEEEGSGAEVGEPHMQVPVWVLQQPGTASCH